MAAYIGKFKQNTLLLTIARFAIVGALGTFIDLTLYSAGKMLLHLPALIANTLSYSAGIANNYYFHRTWTFALQGQNPSSMRFVKFLLVSLTALMINNLVVVLVIPVLAGRAADPFQAVVLAKLLAIVISIGWNFFANQAWTFRA